MRATREGGSPSSSARAWGATKINKPVKSISTYALLFPAKVAFMIIPLSSASSPEVGRRERPLTLWDMAWMLPRDKTQQREISCSLVFSPRHHWPLTRSLCNDFRMNELDWLEGLTGAPKLHPNPCPRQLVKRRTTGPFPSGL